MRYRLITFLVFGILVVGIGEWAAKNHRLRSLNHWWLDFCVGNAAEKIDDPSVTFVRIDEDYVPVFGEDFTRADYAAILGFVSRLEPQSVAFEPSLEFDETILINQDALAPLKAAALTLPELTLGTVVESGQPPQDPSEVVTYPTLSNVKGDLSKVPEITRTVATPDDQMLANGTPAFTAIELDTPAASGEVEIPLIARQGDQLVPGFVIDALVRYAKLTLDDVTVDLESDQPTISIGDRHVIPIDATGHMKIYEHSGIGRQPEDYPDPGDAYRYGLFKSVSAFNLTLTGEDDPQMQQLLEGLQDEFASMKENLVVIGDDHAEIRHTEFSTGDPAISQAQLLSRAIATIQSGRYITWWSAGARLLSAAAIFVLALFIFRLPRKKAVALSLFAAFLYFFVVVAIFKSSLSWAPPFTQMALFGLLAIAALILPDPTKQPATESAAGELRDEMGEEHEEWSGDEGDEKEDGEPAS